MIRLQLRTRYALALLVLLLATVSSLSAVLLTEFSVTADNLRETSAKSMDVGLLRQYERRADDLSITLAESLVNAVYLLQVDNIANVSEGLAGRSDINAIAVFDNGGLLYFSGSIPGVDEEMLGAYHLSSSVLGEAETFVEYYDQSVASNAPVLLNEEIIGHVLVNLSLAPIQEQIALARAEQNELIGNGLKAGLWVSIGITLTFSGLGVILAVFMGDRLSRPIEAVANLARQIGKGNYEIPADIKGTGEVQHLIQSFQRMASDLRQTTVSKTHLDNILHGMLDGLVVVGADGRIQTANRATRNLLGYEESELLGQPVYAFFRTPALADATETDNQPREGTARTKNGDNLPVLLSVSSLRERSAGGASTVWVFRDITRLKQTQNALVAAMQDAERANHAKSQFLANMSHELRTPLNAIIGYSEMLVDEVRDSGQDEMTGDLDRIRVAGRHLLALIDDVLDLSKIEAGKMEVKREEFLLQAVVDDVVATLRPMVSGRGNSLTVDCPANLAPMDSDQIKVRQILSNVLSNAAKFTENGSIHLSVRAESDDDGDWIAIDIADTGIGMTEDQLERVFKEFLQADNSTTRQYGGTGLGLTISHKMANKLGGDISAVSTPGEGSVFSIRLPVRMAERTTATAKLSGQVAAARPGDPNGDAGRILLIINSNPAELELVARRLMLWGFRVVSAKQDEEGLRLAHEIRPFAILVGAMATDEDRGHLVEQLGADPITAGIPVIVAPHSPDALPGDDPLLDRLAALLPPATDKSALVVDSDAAARRLVVQSLQQAGWNIEEAENAQDAMAQIANHVPDLIVLDRTMSEMDGEIFLQALTENSDTATVPVIVLTASPVSAGRRLRLKGRTGTIIEKGADGWVDAVRILGGALDHRAGGGYAVTGE